MDARELVEAARGDLAGVERAIREHPFLAAAERGDVPLGAFRAFAAEQARVIASDRRSFAYLASRFPTPPAGTFFLDLAQGEGVALSRLPALAAAVGADDADEVRPGCQAYPAFVAWLALNGGPADVALAFLANLAAWGEACGRLARALASAYGLPAEAVAFLEFFAEPPPGFEERCLEVIDAALADGGSPAEARRAARLLQAYELAWWDAIAEAG